MAIKERLWVIWSIEISQAMSQREAEYLRQRFTRVRMVQRTVSALGASVPVYVTLYDPDSRVRAKEGT